MAGMFGALARSSDGGRSLELDGVRASIVPACPARSVVNSVVYSDATELERHLPRLAEEYERAGVLAWTVWVPEHDRRAAQALEAAGHSFDAQPSAMVLALDGFEPPAAVAELDLIEPDMASCARVNDIAYGFPGDFERAFSRLPDPPARLYLARVGGVPASTVVTYEEDGECGVYLVATLPEVRGRGLAGAMVAHALSEARERGCTTSSLQATARGRPVYERLGYRPVGALHMWERRRAA